ncbi:MAG: WD40 repeat domain-containing protein [Gemmataceae bacterium]
MRIRQFGSPIALASLLAAALALAAEDDAPPGLVAALTGHKEPVYAVAYSADGKYVVTGAGDPSMKVWDAASGKELKTFAGPNGHAGLVLGVAVAPDGRQFATAAADNTARVWDLPGSAPLREFALASEGLAVAASPDGSRVAGAGKDGKVRVWGAADGKQLHELTGHAGAVNGLAFSPNGQTLVSCGADSTLRHWNAADGRPAGAFAAHPGPVTGVAFHPGGTAVYTSGQDGTARFWSAPTPSRPLAAPFAEGVSALALSPDGGHVVAAAGQAVRLAAHATGATVREFAAPAPVAGVAVNNGGALVAAAAGGKVMLWQGKDGQALMSQPAHAGGVTGVALSPAGNHLATVGQDGWLRLFAVPPAPARAVPHPDAVRAAALSGDGKRLATGGADRTIRLFPIDNLKAPERQLTGHPSAIQALAFRGDARALASGGEDGAVRFWDLEKGESAGAIGGHERPVTSLAWAGDRVLTTSLDGAVKAWQVPGPAGKQTFAHAGAVTCLALSPDGARLLTGCEDKQVRSWALATGQLERTWTGPAVGILCVAVSPKGDRVAAGAADKAVFVWESGGTKLLKRIDTPAAVTALALTPDGKLAVAGLADGSLRLLDLDSGKEVRALDGHKGPVQALTLTAKGDQAVTGGTDGKVLVRSLAGGPPVQAWEHGAPVRALALSRDGARVAVAGDRAAKVYALAGGKVEATVATPAEVRGVAFGADGKRLLVAGGDGRARLYDPDGRLEEYFAHDGGVNAVAFSADGKRVLTAGADKSARTWTPSLVWQGRHDGGARQAIVSPRDQRVLSAGDDGLVRLWNLADGKPAGTIRAHPGAVVALSLTADAGRLVTAGADRTAHVWDRTRPPVEKPIASAALPAGPLAVTVTPDGRRFAVGVEAGGRAGARLRSRVGPRTVVAGRGEAPGRALTFLGDGRTLLAAGADRTARLVDVNVVAALEAHPGGCSSVSFHENGTQVLTGGADKVAKLWTPTTGKLERTFGPLPAGVDAVAIARGGTQVGATSGKTLKAWAAADAKEVLSLEMPAPARGLSFNGDRTRIATANEDGRARVWDAALKLEAQAFLHGGAVTGVAFHPAAPTQLVSAGLDKAVSVHTLSSTRTVGLGSPLNGLAVAPNGGHVFTAGADGKVKAVNTGNGTIDRVLDAGAKAVTSVAVSRSGQLLAAGGADRKVRLFNAADGKPLAEFPAPAEPAALAFSPANNALVAAGSSGAVTAWDVANPGPVPPPDFGKVLQTYQHAAAASGVVFPAVGVTFFTSGGDGVKAWKLASDVAIRNFGHPNSVNSIAYDKAGKLLATGAGDGVLRLFDPDKGSLVRQVSAHAPANNDGAIYAVAFSPDGGQVATASKDGSLKLFNVADGKPIREFRAFKEKDFPKGHQDAVLCAAFSPDGKQLASGGADRAVKVWNVADGTVVRELLGHPGWVFAVRWSNDGKTLLSAGAAPKLRGYLAAWDAASGKQTWAKELAVGTIYALAVAPDGQHIALGTRGAACPGPSAT